MLPLSVSIPSSKENLTYKAVIFPVCILVSSYTDRLKFAISILAYIFHIYQKDKTEKIKVIAIMLLFTHHYPARCFGMNMPKSRDIQAKIPLPQAIWNEFWLRYCERSEQ